MSNELSSRLAMGAGDKLFEDAARKSGVKSAMFGVFHDAGYKGLYNGLGSEAIKIRKGIPREENLMNRMDATELAANQFRMTQAREKLAREKIKGQSGAIKAHEQVGREVRAAIGRIGGTMPESIKPAEHIKQVESRVKKTPPKLQLDVNDARGLIGPEVQKQDNPAKS